MQTWLDHLGSCSSIDSAIEKLEQYDISNYYSLYHHLYQHILRDLTSVWLDNEMFEIDDENVKKTIYMLNYFVEEWM